MNKHSRTCSLAACVAMSVHTGVVDLFQAVTAPGRSTYITSHSDRRHVLHMSQTRLKKQGTMPLLTLHFRISAQRLEARPPIYQI